MNADELFVIMCNHFSSLFPQSCPNCGRRYETLQQYVLETRRFSSAVSYDAELGDWKPGEPIGGVALAHCACGSTLSLSTEGIPLDQIHGILGWLQEESLRRGVTSSALLEEVRDRVRAWALDDAQRPGT